MQIDRIFYPVKTLGFGSRIGIWTLGCPRRCAGCSNPELWASDRAREISLESIKAILRSLKERNGKIDGVTISGGEPFLQAHELAELVVFIRAEISRDILIYTGYTLEELRARDDADVKRCLGACAAIIDGPYVEGLNDNLPLRGSANQRVTVFNARYKSRYMRLQEGNRTMQSIFYDRQLVSIGIPVKGYQTEALVNLKQRGITHERFVPEMAP